MSMINVQVNESASSAKLPKSGRRPEQMVHQARQFAEVIKKHPEYANQADVKQSVEAWTTMVDTLDANQQKLKAARATQVALVQTLLKDSAAWKRAAKRVVAAVNAASGGSAEAIKQRGLTVDAPRVIEPSSAAPTGLRATYTKDNRLVVKWTYVREHRGYFLQVGDGTPTGWGPSIAVTQARYAPEGLALGQKIAIRVAVQRRAGLSAWSDTLIATARA